MRMPYPEKVIACERGGTLKYFVTRDQVFPTWLALGSAYGHVSLNEHMHTVEIRGERLLFLSTLLGNPSTVFRLPGSDDVDRFYAMIGFSEQAP